MRGRRQRCAPAPSLLMLFLSHFSPGMASDVAKDYFIALSHAPCLLLFLSHFRVPQEATAVVGLMGKQLRRSGAIPSYDDLTGLLCSYDGPTIEQAVAAVNGGVSDLDLQQLAATARSSTTPLSKTADVVDDADMGSWSGCPVQPSRLQLQLQQQQEQQQHPASTMLHLRRTSDEPAASLLLDCGSHAASHLKGFEIPEAGGHLPERCRSVSQLALGGAARQQPERSRSVSQQVPAAGGSSLQEQRSRSMSQLAPAVGARGGEGGGRLRPRPRSGDLASLLGLSLGSQVRGARSSSRGGASQHL